MMISIFVLLIMFGGGAAMLALIVYAIVCSRLWIIPVAGGLVFFALIACGLLASIFVPHMQASGPTVVQVNTPPHMVAPGLPNFNAYSAVPVWAFGIKWVAVLGLLLFVLVVRRVVSPRAGHGLWLAWPAIVVAGFIGFIFLVRINASYEQAHISENSAREAAETMAAQQRFQSARKQAELVAKLQKQGQQKQQAIAHGDIHELIEEFEQPRIPIPSQPEAPKSPDAPPSPTPTAVPPPVVRPDALAKSSDKPTDKGTTSTPESKKGETPKQGAIANQKHKKTKATNANDAKASAQTVDQTKTAESSTAKKENKSSNKPIAVLAEAETDKPTARPAWVDELPKRTGNIRREVIATDPYATMDECYQAADIYLLLKTYQRIQELVGKPYTDGTLPSLTFENGQVLADGKIVSYGRKFPYWADERIRALDNMGIGADYIRREIVAKDPKDNEAREYVETVPVSFGAMKKLYLQIEFTQAVDRDLMKHWDARLRTERFAIVGGGAGALLSLLGVVFALLKIDTWTKGYYTKRLFIGVPAAIIAGFLLLAILGTHSYR